MTTVRPARLEDTERICGLYQQRVSAWQRLDEEGYVADVPYEALTIYERWLHGGPWLSLETGAIHLNHLLLGAGLTFVAESKQQLVGYAEVYRGSEPRPFGQNLHLADLIINPDFSEQEVELALVDALLEQVGEQRVDHLLVNRADYSAPEMRYQSGYDLQTCATVRRFTLPARTGQIFYKAVEHLNADPAQIDGWQIIVGRFGSSRQQWEALMPRMWDAIPEIHQRRRHRLRFSAAGQEAFVVIEQQLYDPRAADVYAWSPRVLSTQLLSAIRDWAHRENYRVLRVAVTENMVKTLGADAEADGYQHEVCIITPRSDDDADETP